MLGRIVLSLLSAVYNAFVLDGLQHTIMELMSPVPETVMLKLGAGKVPRPHTAVPTVSIVGLSPTPLTGLGAFQCCEHGDGTWVEAMKRPALEEKLEA